MNTTVHTPKDRGMNLGYYWPRKLHDEIQAMADALPVTDKNHGKRSPMAEHLLKLGVLADSERILPPALVEQVSELAARQGLPFPKALENVLAAGLPVAREDAAGVS